MVGHRSTPITVSLVLAASAVSAGCDLTEVTVPTGEQVVVVQAIMRPDQDIQSVFVEYSLAGQRDLASGGRRLAINGAVVTVTNHTRSRPGCTGPIQFINIDRDAGRYASPAGCPMLETGDALELNVRTREGEEVTGTMNVPGMRGMIVTLNDTALASGTGQFRLNRDNDTLRFNVERGSGRGLLVELQPLIGLVNFGSRTSFFVDTMSLRLFGNLSFDFDDAADPLFRAGRFTTVSVGIMDENFFRFFQTRNDPFTGRGFDNRLEGGLGVFGGLDPRFFRVRAVGDIDDPREGIYRLKGMLGNNSLDLSLELYLVDNEVNTQFSAFVTGTFPGQGELDVSVDGLFQDDVFQAFLDLSISQPQVYLLRASGALAASFDVDVVDPLGRLIGTVRATR